MTKQLPPRHPQTGRFVSKAPMPTNKGKASKQPVRQGNAKGEKTGMNINPTYNRPLRIISKPGDKRGFFVYVYDAQTEETIDNVKAATIYLNADGINTVELTYYERDEQGHIVTDGQHEPIMGKATITSDKHEVDLSVWEI